MLDAKGLERQPAAHGGVSPKAAPSKGMRLGRYELGRTLGEGNFGKVKYARHVDSGRSFAVKILEKNRILDLRITDQVSFRYRYDYMFFSFFFTEFVCDRDEIVRS